MSEDKSTGWVNNFAQMWSTKKDKKKYFLSIPLAEPVTVKLQRKVSGGGFAVEEVTLVPTENDKGYKSVNLPMRKVEGNDKFTPPENLRQEISVPPGAQGDGESDF